MIKRLLSLFLACVFALIFCGTVLACDEDQTNTYLLQILFGDSSAVHENEDNTKMLLNALYLCSEQSGNSGQDKIDYLKRMKVNSVPSLSDLQISSDCLIDCSHNSWEHKFSAAPKVQETRIKLLQNTVNKVFDFGLLNNIFRSRSGKCNSFSALLYYFHILADYLADDPDETVVSINGRVVTPYSGDRFCELNGGMPKFSKRQKEYTECFIQEGNLDELKRPGAMFAVIGPEWMIDYGSRPELPTPVAFKQHEYNGIVKSSDLYNRCHLIARRFCGNDSLYNLVTGTKYMNENMGKKEDDLAKYISETGNHVLYRVTPIYKGDNLMVSGVQMEAFSLEDKGEKHFNVYCYNVQPGIDLDYRNGTNTVSDLAFGSKEILPFAEYNATNDNPDLLLEITKHLEILFKDQKETITYKVMMGDIYTIAHSSRAVIVNNSIAARKYEDMKMYQYKFVKTLINYIPILLSREEFFKSAFK